MSVQLKSVHRTANNLSIVLINPNVPGYYNITGSVSTNPGIGALSAYVKKYSNHDVNIIDASASNLSPEDAFKKIQKTPPDIVGISLCVHKSIPWTNSLIDLIKNTYKTTHITLGGYFPSLLLAGTFEYLPKIDSVIFGEGEITFFELISNIFNKFDCSSVKGIAYKKNNNEIITNERRESVDLNILPWSDHYLLKGDGSNVEIMIEGSRGCMFSCSFCSFRPFNELTIGPLFRMRTAESIFNEVSYLKKKYPNSRGFIFNDPDFMIPRFTQPRSIEFAKLVIKNNLHIKYCVSTRPTVITPKIINDLKLLKESGLISIYLGVESGSQRILNHMRKGTTVESIIQAIEILNEVDIDYDYGFMMITPWTTEEDIEKSASLLKKIRHFGMSRLFHEMVIVPKSAVFNEMKQSNRLVWTGDMSYYTYKTNCTRVENFRNIRIAVESNFSSLFARMYHVNDIILYFRPRKNDFLFNIGEFCYEAESLALEIFEYCWEKSAQLNLTQEEVNLIAQICFEKFSEKVDAFLKTLQVVIPLSHKISDQL